ncbi:hypothetical protein TSMEX_010247 [Taenia solium]|eukprot:TsM_000166700 transcript=TsM_000166700 gene=TsM_000166700
MSTAPFTHLFIPQSPPPLNILQKYLCNSCHDCLLLETISHRNCLLKKLLRIASKCNGCRIHWALASLTHRHNSHVQVAVWAHKRMPFYYWSRMFSNQKLRTCPPPNFRILDPVVAMLLALSQQNHKPLVSTLGYKLSFILRLVDTKSVYSRLPTPQSSRLRAWEGVSHETNTGTNSSIRATFRHSCMELGSLRS